MPVMSRRRAAQILGVRPTATLAEAKAAHRKRQQDDHPDRSGGDENRAKQNNLALSAFESGQLVTTEEMEVLQRDIKEVKGVQRAAERERKVKNDAIWRQLFVLLPVSLGPVGVMLTAVARLQPDANWSNGPKSIAAITAVWAFIIWLSRHVIERHLDEPRNCAKAFAEFLPTTMRKGDSFSVTEQLAQRQRDYGFVQKVVRTARYVLSYSEPEAARLLASIGTKKGIVCESQTENSMPWDEPRFSLTIELDDQRAEIEEANLHKRLRWEKVGRILRVGGFGVLYCVFVSAMVGAICVFAFKTSWHTAQNWTIGAAILGSVAGIGIAKEELDQKNTHAIANRSSNLM